MRFSRTILLAGVFFSLLLEAADPRPLDRGELGRRVKFTILVDKVMQPEAGWVTEEWMVKEAAETGFNVFSPRRGHDRLEEVKQVTEWCAKYGIFHMPWVRGTLAAPPGPEADGKRLIWENGAEQPLFSPNADPLWDRLTKYCTAYAEMSARDPHLIGVFLDFENYAPGSQGNCYRLSYDEVIMKKFAQARGITLPALAPAERKPYLVRKGLFDAFKKFQIDHWRERCRKLRRAVDKFNPTFQFCIYPAPGTMFMVEAAYPAWATEKAPLILADAVSYGRPSRFSPEAEALARNRKNLVRRRTIPQKAGIPFFYAGGIDPVVRGADPEFCGKNAVAISEVTDGYWVFYEGPSYKKDHKAYFKWFKWANEAIRKGEFDLWKTPRKTPEAFLDDVFKKLRPPAGLVPPPPLSGGKVEYKRVRFRGPNIFLLSCRGGRSVRITLRDMPVGSYRSPVGWEVRNGKGERIAWGTVPYKKAGEIEFTPKRDGIHRLAVSAGGCAYVIERSTVPVGVLASGRGVGVIGGARRFYFAVPPGVREFAVTIKGSGFETVRVRIFDPEGREAASGETTPQKESVRVACRTKVHSPGIWSLTLTRADEGAFEDASLSLENPLTPIVSLRKEEVFRGK